MSQSESSPETSSQSRQVYVTHGIDADKVRAQVLEQTRQDNSTTVVHYHRHKHACGGTAHYVVQCGEIVASWQ